MNLEKVAERLGMTKERLEGLLGTTVKSSSWPEPRLLRFEKTVSGVEAGTVVFENGEIVSAIRRFAAPWCSPRQ